ncbi:MAG: hypothetical protein AB8B96_07025 [Lysobacterales bacterium]
MKSFLTIVLLATLAACASMPGQPETLEQRIAAKWDLLVVGEYAAAYQYYSPGYRSINSEATFVRAMSSRTIPWLAVRVGEIGPCEPDTCSAKVEIDYRVQPRVPGARVFESTKIVPENWIKQNNTWFYVPKQ